MGIYLNKGNSNFQECLNDNIYVDHSMLIEYTNNLIGKREKYICVSRPRRFGKSTDADMLVAYYSKGYDSHEQFDNLKISKVSSYEKHLNNHNVIKIDMQQILNRTEDYNEFIKFLTNRVMNEFIEIYGNVRYYDKTNLVTSLEDIYIQTEEK
jgi:hypothetical protein